MTSSEPRAFRVIGRGLLARCPACGYGHVFREGVRSATACGVCGWRFERCPGHWVGGNEINLLVSFTAGVPAYVLAALAFGMGGAAVAIAVATTVVVSLAFYRSSRGLFYALDYLVDPTPDAPVDDGGGRGPDAASSPPNGPPPAPRRRFVAAR